MEDIIIGTNQLYEAQAQATLSSINRTSKKAVRFRETCLAVVVVIARVRDEVLYTFFAAPSKPLRSCQTLVLANVRQAPRPLLTVNFRQPSHEFTFNVGIDLLF
jgi:hypothetical protein